MLRTLTIFDKPDPLDGPFFEETIYTTPSRLPKRHRRAIAERAAAAAGSIGLRDGPVHAELRVNERGPWMLEIAGRSIGGLCSTILEFGAGMSLEELILRNALRMETPSADRATQAAGVMMIPIPKGGMLHAVSGVEEALATPHVDGHRDQRQAAHRDRAAAGRRELPGLHLRPRRDARRGRSGPARRARPSALRHPPLLPVLRKVR